ncbi:hypothetical protein [Deinococcus indicus]|uniref:hypothetical protein n=1 Tax=Deinococcus indicus TaxID=223556 RepID=UPI0011778607|nr:hypothetical protein [Deinococcus indicus]
MTTDSREQLEKLVEYCDQILKDLKYITEHMNYKYFMEHGFELHFGITDTADSTERIFKGAQGLLNSSTSSQKNVKEMLDAYPVMIEQLDLCKRVISILHRSYPTN